MRELSADEVDHFVMAHGSVLLGTNAKLNGKVARSIGWEPTGESFEEEIKRVVKNEAAGGLIG